MWNVSNKQKFQQARFVAILFGLPILLNACSVLNGERLRIYGSAEDDHPQPAAAPSAQSRGAGTPPATVARPPSLPPTQATACIPTALGTLEANNEIITAINGDVVTIEATSPQKTDLRHLIIEYGLNDLHLARSAPELRVLAENILARSPSAPAPSAPQAPNPGISPNIAPTARSAATENTARSTSTPPPPTTAPAAPTPYFLHQSIVAFVVHKKAFEFAIIRDKLALDVSHAKIFADHFLAHTQMEQALATYIKGFNFAANPAKLSVNAATAQEMLNAAILRPNGVALINGYIEIFDRETEFGASRAEAIAIANQAICFDVATNQPITTAPPRTTAPAGTTSPPAGQPQTTTPGAPTQPATPGPAQPTSPNTPPQPYTPTPSQPGGPTTPLSPPRSATPGVLHAPAQPLAGGPPQR